MIVNRNQQGATLVVAMVLLLVMSLIGLSSVVSSTLQEKMASNAQQRTLARAAAESGLAAAERFIATQITATSKLIQFNGDNTGYYSAYPVPGIILETKLAKQVTDLADAADPSIWTAANSVEVDDLSSAVQSKKPRYTIEYVGRRSQSGISVWSPSAVIERGAPHIFKVTAIGWARDTAVYSVLQSYFMTGTGAGVFEYEE
ncbi:pilus assembly PilX family protein [Simiduia agarivorans]|uniref:Tfp pilus assembly protein PilX n=1 Tax=Simiduia agarivorans (strain DSM 21679 / JCM 13881 / BCRC 17597 / SA1) TaxID=1117647 RepID=K4KLH9_SIMAS|nr:PilX N-terminal domain-containing pilus assembly protein [Simiduia agarivorans]AFU98918.1 Tfp pilus assembly protein PilX [Simiduia agarivorans SA1 = DSM 21679]